MRSEEENLSPPKGFTIAERILIEKEITKILKIYAKIKKTITYPDIVDQLSKRTNIKLSTRSPVFNEILTNISKATNISHDAILPAVAVRNNGKPGNGFFDCVRKIRQGTIINGIPIDKISNGDLFIHETQKVHKKTW